MSASRDTGQATTSFSEIFTKSKKTVGDMGYSIKFEALPQELQDHITGRLDPATLVSFRQTCRRYYSSMSLEDHLHEVEMLSKHRANYACSLCRSVKPEPAFALRQISGHKKKEASRRTDRFCEACGVKYRLCNSVDIGHHRSFHMIRGPRKVLS